jgi:hypothetical protein
VIFLEIVDHLVPLAVRRGRRVRHKVRIRHYPDRRLTMFEVKTRRSVRFGQPVEAVGRRKQMVMERLAELWRFPPPSSP